MRLLNALVMVLFFLFFFSASAQWYSYETEGDFVLKNEEKLKELKNKLTKNGYVILSDYQKGDIRGFQFSVNEDAPFIAIVAYEKGTIWRWDVRLYTIIAKPKEAQKPVEIVWGKDDLYDLYYLNNNTQSRVSNDPAKTGIIFTSIPEQLEKHGMKSVSVHIKTVIETYFKKP